jgi:hypothetical protein
MVVVGLRALKFSSTEMISVSSPAQNNTRAVVGRTTEMASDSLGFDRLAGPDATKGYVEGLSVLSLPF